MASFPEVVLRVRFRWQQFNKYAGSIYEQTATEKSLNLVFCVILLHIVIQCAYVVKPTGLGHA